MAHTFLGSVKLKGCDPMLTRDEKIKQVQESLQKFNKDKIDVQEAASIMGCHPETVRRHIEKGYIKAAAIGRTHYTSKQWLREYIVSDNFFHINNIIKTHQITFEENKCKIIGFCSLPRTAYEIQKYIGYCDVLYTRKVLLRMVAENKLVRLPRKNRATCYQYIATLAENSQS